jgi:hypothetical protein
VRVAGKCCDDGRVRKGSVKLNLLLIELGESESTKWRWLCENANHNHDYHPHKYETIITYNRRGGVGAGGMLN